MSIKSSLKLAISKVSPSTTFFNKTKSGAGFTLIELLLYIAMTSIIILVVSNFIGVSMQARIKNQTIAEVENQGQQIMTAITQSIRNANAITSPTVGTSASSLTLSFIDAGKNPTIFDLSGGKARVTEGAGSNINLNSSKTNISSLTFENVSYASTPGIIKVVFTVNYVNPSGRNEYNYSQTFYNSASLRK